MKAKAKAHSQAAPQEAAVMTKATLRAADRLGIRSSVLAKIVGVSEATVSRMRKGEYIFERGQKSFELAILFVRLYRSLDAIVGGDDTIAAAWLKNENTALQRAPLELVQKITGLIDVIAYLDARRAVV